MPTHPFLLQYLKAGLCLTVGKLLLLIANGYLYADIDSQSYLTPGANLYHPPGYMLFLWLARQCWDNTFFIGLLHCIIWGFGLSILIAEIRMAWLYWAIIGIMIVEPTGNFFTQCILSEVLYIPAVSIGLWALKQYIMYRKYQWVILSGIFLGGAYLIRYSGFLIGMPAFVVLVFISKLKKRYISHAILFFVAFQLIILPVRAYFYLNFDTWQFNGFSAMYLWNSTSVIFPGSAVQRAPQTPFEKWAASYPDSVFTFTATVHTGALWSAELPLTAYIRRYPDWQAKQIFDFADTLMQTNRKLLLSHPLKYITVFILPNLVHSWYFDDCNPYMQLLPLFSSLTITGSSSVFCYPSYLTQITYLSFIVLLITIIYSSISGQWILTLPAILWLLSFICLSCLAVLFPRFVITYLPLTLVLGGQLVDQCILSGNSGSVGFGNVMQTAKEDNSKKHIR
jgi:hypothetical protein